MVHYCDQNSRHPTPIFSQINSFHIIQHGPFKTEFSNPCTGLDRPWGFQIVEVPRFQYNRHMKVVRMSALRTGHLYPQETSLVFICVRGWVDPRATMRPEWLRQWDIPTIPSRIERAICRLVVQFLNQLRHRVPPNWIYYCTKIYIKVYLIMFAIQVFQPEFFRRFSTLQHVPHVPVISSSFISLPY